MNILNVYAHHIDGTNGVSTQRAFENLGHKVTTKIADKLTAEDLAYDYILCVDSMMGVDFTQVAKYNLAHVGYWLIDFRFNKWMRGPINDLQNCKILSDAGGLVLQAQYEDHLECQAKGIRSEWLPLGADETIWRIYPDEPLLYDFGFIGSVHDKFREGLLARLADLPLSWVMSLNGEFRSKPAAQFTNRLRMGFNIGSFWLQPYCYDVNMRVFETLACGTPLITNRVQGLSRLFGEQPFVKTYSDPEELFKFVPELLQTDFISPRNRKMAAEFILDCHTYKHRLLKVLNENHSKN